MAFNEEQMVLSKFQAVKFTDPFVLKGEEWKQKNHPSKSAVVEVSENEDRPNVSLMFSYEPDLQKPCLGTLVSWHLSSEDSDTSVIFVVFELRPPRTRMEEGKGLIW